MLLPQGLQHLRTTLQPMATTPLVRGVSDAMEAFLGRRGGIVRLLATNTGWIREFQGFAEILLGTVPGLADMREARALAGITPAIYLPGTGALVNGALVAGTTRADMEDALAKPSVAGAVAIHLAHELAGHAYMAENTRVGRDQISAQTWRQTVAFAGRVLPVRVAQQAADDRLATDFGRWVIIAEGWSRWVTGKLKPYLSEALPHLSAVIMSEAPSPAQSEADVEAAEALRGLLASGPLSSTTLDSASALFAGVAASSEPGQVRALGLALFEELERKAGFPGCLDAIAVDPHQSEASRPEIALLRVIAQINEGI